MEKKPKFELFQGVNRDWYWHLKAPNGQIIASSEGYSSQQMAKHGITSVKHNAEIAETVVSEQHNLEVMQVPKNEILDE